MNLYASYFEHPFKTRTHVEKLTHMKLPAISLCSKNFDTLANATDAERDAMITLLIYRLFNNASSMGYSEAFAKTAVSAPYNPGIKKEDFILKAYVRAREIDIAAEFEVSENYLSGPCFVFNGMKDGYTQREITLGHGENLYMFLNIDQGRYLARDTAAGVNVIFHDPNDKLSSHSQSVVVAPGMSTTIGLTPTQYKFLPKPFKSFGDEGCMNDHDILKLKKLRWHRKYTWWSCVEECIFLQAVHVCKCQPDSGVPLKTWKLAYLQNGSACQCPQPCHFVKYDLRTSLAAFPSHMISESLLRNGHAESYQQIRDDFMEVRVTFDGMILYHVEHVPEITPSDIFGKLGGQMGFFLGASLLTLTELIEVVIRTVLIVVFEIIGRRNNAVVNGKY
ncbi:acid-sensing ion channel 4-A-like [Haliotis asinina]|uniref:acid-sensing ion channel 4-A-like n=1 Tax=Haliotis asinina TaxID=109174 RepID=UPI00353191DF